MRNNFQMVALSETNFSYLFSMNHEELQHIGAVKMIADTKPGYPCRISLKDAEIGDTVILLNYEYHSVNSPYKSTGPIFVRKDVKMAKFDVNEIPEMLLHRTLSIRGYDCDSMMISARLAEGIDLSEAIDEMFDNIKIAYLHVHNAKPGCYNCLVKRV